MKILMLYKVKLYKALVLRLFHIILILGCK